MLAKIDKNIITRQINNFFYIYMCHRLDADILKLYNSAYIFTKIVFQFKIHTMTHDIS